MLAVGRPCRATAGWCVARPSSWVSSTPAAQLAAHAQPRNVAEIEIAEFDRRAADVERDAAAAIDGADGAAIAVGEVVHGQVLAHHQHVARRDPAGSAAGLIDPKPAGDPQVTTGAQVEVDHVAAAMGEHHHILGRALRDPVGHEPLACGG